MMKKLILAIFLSLFMLAIAFSKNKDIVIGCIDSIDGQDSSVSLIHSANKLISPKPGTLLSVGDKISVAKSGTTVWVSLWGHPESIAITKENASKLGMIKELDNAPDVYDKLWQWLVDLTPGHQQQTSAVSMASRGGIPNIELPTLPAGMGTAKAGKRDWIVTWRGGIAPYTLRIIREDGKQQTPIIEMNALKKSPAILSGRDLAPGQYRLEVESTGKKATATLKIIPKNDLPNPPQALSHSVIPEGLKQLLYITWLYGQDSDQWAFEAQQEAFMVSHFYPPARQVLLRIGERKSSYLK